MPTESSPDVKFEIGHVLFIDIVGYSNLLITQQTAQIETIKKIVRGTEQFRLAEAEGKLLRNFFSELKRRNVYKVAVAYAVVSWLLVQATSSIPKLFL